MRPGVLVWLLVVVTSGGILARGFSIDDDLTLFLPSDAEPVQRLLLERVREGPQSRSILIGLGGSDAGTRAAASRALAERLRDLPGVARVENGEHRLDRAGLAKLFERRYLLGEPSPFDRESLRAALQARLDDLRTGFGALDKQHLTADPTARFRRLVETWLEAGRVPERRAGLWASPDGTQALLLVETVAGGFDLADQAALVAQVRERLADVEERFGVDGRITGPVVFAVDARAATRAEAQRFSLLGSALVVALLLLAFRSWRIVILGLVPLGTGVLVAIAAVLLTWGSIHGITLAFGITLLGVAIDYPLHLFSHAAADEPLTRTAATVWPPLRLGMITTVLGYGAMATPDLAGLAQLGLFASTGLLTAGLALRYVLPALFPGRPPPSRPWLRPALGRITPTAWRAMGVGLLAAAALSVAFLASRSDRVFETDLAGLSPVPEAARQLDRELRSALGAADLRHLLLLQADTVEAALRLAETLEPELRALAEAGAIGGYELISRYLPSAATQRARQARLPSREMLADELAAARRGLPFKPGAFEPFLDAVAQTSELAPVRREDLADTPLAPRIEALLADQGENRYVFVPLVGVDDAEAVAALARSHAAVTYADLKRLSEATLQRLQESALVRVAIGGGVILALLMISLRQGRRVLVVGGALALALLLTTAALVGMGERLSLFHIVAGLLVVGIGVDYGVFFGWPASDLDRRRTLGAVTLCLLSTVAVFGVLATSDIVALRAIGLTVSTGAIISFVSTLALVWSPPPAGAGDGRAAPG